MPLHIAQERTADGAATTWARIDGRDRQRWDQTLQRALGFRAIRAAAEDLTGQQEGALAEPATTVAASSAAVVVAAPSAAPAPSLPALVYVHQREIALVSPRLHPHIQLVGSADATTCVILLLQCAATKRVVCAHFDGADRAQIWGASAPSAKAAAVSIAKAAAASPSPPSCTSLLDALNQLSDEDCSAGIEVHMAGGFQTNEEAQGEEKQSHGEAEAAADEEDEAEEQMRDTDSSDGLVQVREILRLLDAYSTPGLAAGTSLQGARVVDFRVQTLCVGPRNTQWQADGPDAGTAAIAASSSPASAVVASSVSSTATPASAAASVALSYPRPYLTSLFLDVRSGALVGRLPLGRGDRGPDMVLRMLRGCLGPAQDLAQPYDEKLDQFVVRAFNYRKMNVAGLRSLLSLPDSEFLLRSSTSPLVEPPNFLPDIREAYQWLVTHPTWQATFPQGENQLQRWKRDTATSVAATPVAAAQANQWQRVE